MFRDTCLVSWSAVFVSSMIDLDCKTMGTSCQCLQTPSMVLSIVDKHAAAFVL